jgi:hypothetical protein
VTIGLDGLRILCLGGFVSVLANGEESATFKTGKGLRQGDPCLPYCLTW